MWATLPHTGASEGELRSPRILRTISLFYRKEDREKSRLRGRLQLFFYLIPCVGISSCRRGNFICR